MSIILYLLKLGRSCSSKEMMFSCNDNFLFNSYHNLNWILFLHDMTSQNLSIYM